MSRAASRVDVTLRLKGQDQASKSIRSVTKSTDGLRHSMIAVGDAGDQAADRAGKLSTALSSLGDFAGHSEKSFRRASEAAGAFDDVLTIMPGPIGIAIGVIGGLATITALAWKEAKEAEARFKNAFGAERVAELKAFKDATDTSAENVTKIAQAAKDAGVSLAQIRPGLDAARKAAEAAGDDGGEAMVRFAQKLRDVRKEAKKVADNLRRIADETRAAALAENTPGFLRGDFAEAFREGAKQLRDIDKQIEKATGNLGEQRRLMGERYEIERRLASVRDLARRAALEDMEATREAAAAERDRVRSVQAQNRLKARERAAAAMAKARERAAGERKFESDIVGEAIQIENQAAIEARRSHMIILDQEREKEAQQAAARAQFHEEHMRQLRESTAEAVKGGATNRQVLQDRIDMYFSVASSAGSAIGSIMKIMGEEEKAMRIQAGIEAAIAFGRGLVAAGQGKVAQAAAFFAGSLALGAQAIGGGSRPATSGAGQGIGTGTATAAAGAGGGGGGTVVNVSFGSGFVMGTAEQVGAAVNKAVGAAKAAGF